MAVFLNKIILKQVGIDLEKFFLFSRLKLKLFMSIIFLTPSLFTTNYFLLLFFIISQLLSSKTKIKWLILKKTWIRPVQSIDVTPSGCHFCAIKCFVSPNWMISKFCYNLSDFVKNNHVAPWNINNSMLRLSLE